MSIGQIPPTAVEPSGEGRVVQKKTWRLEEIKGMSAAEYQMNLGNPDFAKAVDEMFTPAPPEPEKTA